MIVLTVQSFNGAATEALSASFDELGGTIGRADTNQLVLPDPERSISRIHAQVVFRNGRYTIADRGSNAVLVNGQPVGNGREAPLRDGDQLQVGGYLIAVSFGHKTQARDPFADLFGGPAPAAPAPAPVASPPGATLWPPTPPSPPARPAAPAASRAPAAPAASVIPEDWDPFADPVAPAGSSSSSSSSSGSGGLGDFGFDAPAPAAGNPFAPALPVGVPSSEDSLDHLFDLGRPGSAPADPFAHTPAAATGPVNMANDADPMRSLGMSAAPVAAPQADHASELNLPWEAPSLKAVAAPPAPVAPAAVPAPPPGAVLSWNQPAREGRVVAGARRAEAPVDPGDRTHIVIGHRKPPAAPAPAPTPLPPDLGMDFAAPPAPAVPLPAAAPARAAGGSDELLRALLDGLGMPQLAMESIDARRMKLLGQLLREATHGTVQLLVARAALKREMRAEMTMIVARENNPLKFSPNVEVALQHLLGTPTPGFMAAPNAMRDAFDDLRAHQLGVMAGMRAALAGVLKRFDPAELEGKITKRGGLGALLPGSRKAQLWEQFQLLYAQLSEEAAEDFHELFGKAFLQAYEAELDQLQRDA